MAQLTAHDWPGNVRELQNAIERAVILSRGGPLRFELATSRPVESSPSKYQPSQPSRLLTRADLKRHERESIVAALKETNCRIFGANGAAELLAMKPTTLASRIKTLGLKRRGTT